MPERATPEAVGDLAIVLHSHMPYVEGFGTYPFGEEWLFDAVLRSYLPVLEAADGVTMTVTPVLADQLEAPGVPERLRAFARDYRLEAAEAEVAAVEAGEAPPEHGPAYRAEADRYRQALARLDGLGDDLLEAFRSPAREGRVELMGSAATHAVLPLIATLAGRRLQVDAGLRSHGRRFGEPAGFWLPECAYEPGLDRLLAERGVRHLCVDQSAHENSLAALAPVATPAGPVAFTVDWEAVSWLWSLEGYPSDPAYADFHRKSMHGMRPWAIGDGAYDPAAAESAVARHAAEFVGAVAARLRRFREERGRHGLLVFAIDTELLGHWWWEGPAWLAEVVARAPAAGVQAVNLSQASELHEAEERPLRASTWGEAKDLRTWDSPEVADLAWAARRLELRLLRALSTNGISRPAAERATRELLALQASDWAFLDSRRQAGDYPWQRSTAHGEALLDALHSGQGGNGSDHPAERDAEPEPSLRNLAPDLSLVPLLEP